MSKTSLNYYVSTLGKDTWSGRLPEPNNSKTDGPFLTPGRAQQAIRQVKEKTNGLPCPVHVFFREGIYHLSRTLTFTPKDSGTQNCSISYTAYPGEHPILRGGRRIGDWTRGENGLWSTYLKEVHKGRWYFEQLFSNGTRITRSRLPHDGFWQMADFTSKEDNRSFRFVAGDIRRWHNLQDVQIHMLKSWDDSRLRILDVDEKDSIVRFTGPTMADQRDGTRHPRRDEGPQARYFADNVYEGLDAPGRWYLDRTTGILNYRPASEQENPNEAEIIAPVLSCLLRCQGRRTGLGRVEFLRFDGLEFEYADWTLPPEGYAGRQACFIDPAAIDITNTWDCSFVHGRVAHVGGYVMSIGRGCRNLAIENNVLVDAGAGGIKMGEDVSIHLHEDANVGIIPNLPERLYTKQNRIFGNHIYNCGTVFFGSVGISIAQSSDNRVEKNNIHNLPYTGISLGYMWSNIETRCKRNCIEGNEIYQVMQLMNDGAGIYCLGRSHGTMIRSNVIYGCRPPFTNHARGIYLDESTAGVMIQNNLIYDTGDGALLLHICWDNIIENNIFLEGLESQLYFCFERGRETGQGNIFRNNIFYFSRPDSLFFQAYPLPVPENVRLEKNLFFVPRDALGVRVYMDADGKWLDPPWRANLFETNLDQGSTVQEPLFVDPTAGDYRLKGSPILFEHEFKPFAFDDQGLKKYIEDKRQEELK
jgi:parallel beta-helix repeat protein